MQVADATVRIGIFRILSQGSRKPRLMTRYGRNQRLRILPILSIYQQVSTSVSFCDELNVDNLLKNCSQTAPSV